MRKKPTIEQKRSEDEEKSLNRVEQDKPQEGSLKLPEGKPEAVDKKIGFELVESPAPKSEDEV
jgi:hypothetical protein